MMARRDSHGSVFRPNVPRGRTLLRQSGLGLKLSGLILSPSVGAVLSVDQVSGGFLLKQASRFKTDRTRVRMNS